MESFTSGSNNWATRLACFVGPPVILFAVVYAAALTFVYIEGDDAASIVYHAMGRDAWLQPPYSAYHGMMDVILGWLPADERLVRFVAIGITACAAPVMVILVLMLIRGWLGPVRWTEHAVIASFLLICTPEVFYLGLVYTPSLVAMCCAIGAHLLVRNALDTQTSSSAAMLVVSAIVFGVGAACRWDVGVYLFFIVADLLFSFGKSMRIWMTVGLWSLGAFVMSLASIYASGYGLAEINDTLALARAEILNEDSWFALAGAHQTFFTPALVILFAAGWLVLLKNNLRLALLCVAGVLPILPFLISREPKMILPALPGLWLAVSAGLEALLDPGNRANSISVWAKRATVTILAAGPWLVGVQVDSAETSWGPGFGLKSPVAVQPSEMSGVSVSDQVDRRAVAVRNWSLSSSGGFAIPTPEGARPLGGHLSVLIGGEWRRLHSDLDRERSQGIRIALESGYPILQDEGNSFIVAKLLELGFGTNDRRVDYEAVVATRRRFVNDVGEEVDLYLLRARRSLFTSEALGKLAISGQPRKAVHFSGYSSTIRKLVDDAPSSADVLGPFTAVIDIDALEKSLNN